MKIETLYKDNNCMLVKYTNDWGDTFYHLKFWANPKDGIFELSLTPELTKSFVNDYLDNAKKSLGVEPA